jgi:hypothetical protein
VRDQVSHPCRTVTIIAFYVLIFIFFRNETEIKDFE